VVLADTLQNRKDQDLCIFFEWLIISNPNSYPYGRRPTAHGSNAAEKAQFIREWMSNPKNLAILDKMDAFDVNGKMRPDINSSLETLPPEVKLLKNLRHVEIDYPGFRELPEGFNPQKLTTLMLRGTQITALPAFFNPPLLQRIDLSDTKVVCLPKGFNPPNLTVAVLNNTPLTALSEGFNPLVLIELHLDDTQIAALPDGFDGESLRVFGLANTPITELPESFTASIFLRKNNFRLTNTHITKVSTKLAITHWPDEIAGLRPLDSDSDDDSD
jgi:hypothetical protein